MTTKELVKKLKELVGPDLAGQVEKKLTKASKAGEAMLFKGATFADLDATRSAENELQRVQLLVSDFLELAQMTLAEGETDLSGLITELQDRLDLTGEKSLVDVVKERLQPAEPFAAWRKTHAKEQDARPWVEAFKAAATPFAGGGIFDNIAAGNQAYEHTEPGGVADTITGKVRLSRAMQEQLRRQRGLL